MEIKLNLLLQIFYDDGAEADDEDEDDDNDNGDDNGPLYAIGMDPIHWKLYICKMSYFCAGFPNFCPDLICMKYPQGFRWPSSNLQQYENCHQVLHVHICMQ